MAGGTESRSETTTVSPGKASAKMPRAMSLRCSRPRSAEWNHGISSVIINGGVPVRFKYRKAVTGLDQGWLDLPTLVFAAVCWFVVVRQTQVQRAMLQSRHIMFGD